MTGASATTAARQGGGTPSAHGTGGGVSGGGSGGSAGGHRASGATEFIDFTVPVVVWGSSDGLATTLPRRTTMKATFHVLMTGALARPTVDVHGQGARVFACTDVTLAQGRVATFACSVEVQGLGHSSVTVTGVVRSKGDEYSATWSHTVAG